MPRIHSAAPLLLAATSLFACAGSVPPVEPDPAPAGAAAAPPPSDCSSGVVLDDGSVETGYGFVPSATYGIYVQRFESSAFRSRQLEQVCICWLKTRHGVEAEFEVVFYGDAGGRPAAEPYATVEASATDLPASVEEAGRFVAVDVSGVTLAEGTSYVGARWKPDEAKFLFICTDTSETTAETRVFFSEDRAPAWTDVRESRDPIFRDHRAIGVRVMAAKADVESP